MSLLRVEHIKKYTVITRLSRMSLLRLTKGAALGCLVQNGVGKTTTMKIIEDILPATSG